jgi:NADP-dependent 3-hydroxy acid dehydrogenase YdfG
MSLTNESVVVITGAGSGIGRAMAVRFAREPIAGIAISDVNSDGLAETAAMITAADRNVTTHIVDVSNEAQMQAFAGEVIEKHGRASHLINNAGVALGGRVSEVSLEDMHWLVNINFWGVVHGTKIFMPHLQKEKSAHIVNFSSIFGIIAPPGQATYCASKFAVRGFTEALRHELEGTNVAVSVVHPGGVKTNIANSARMGSGVELSDVEVAKKRERINRNLDRTSPEQAAEIVFAGVKSRNPRIIIGGDAKLIQMIARTFPRSYFKVINRLSGGRITTT